LNAGKEKPLTKPRILAPVPVSASEARGELILRRELTLPAIDEEDTDARPPKHRPIDIPARTPI